MFKIYEKYIKKKFFKKFFLICLVFFTLGIILNIFEEISFFKNLETNFILPYFLTLLNAPITLFEIFLYFWYLHNFFYEIIKNDEIILLKIMVLVILKL